MSGPETLADVKVGDEVWVFLLNEPGSLLRVDRLTPARIFLADGGMFSKSDGYEVGGFNFAAKRFIQLGEKAEAQNSRRNRSAKIRAAEIYPLQTQGHKEITQEQVQNYRAACDRAETVLRDLGEWSDPP